MTLILYQNCDSASDEEGSDGEADYYASDGEADYYASDGEADYYSSDGEAASDDNEEADESNCNGTKPGRAEKH